METKKNSILDFLSEYSVVEIPIWQREYVWQTYQTEQLFLDIEKLIKIPKANSHFFGVLVIEPKPDNISGIKLIDGHQRIITISIFLCALCDFFKADRYKKALLFSSFNKQQISKVKYLNEYKDQYENILLNEDFAYMTNSIYTKLYRFFYDKINSKKYKLEHYFNALKHFEIIEILLTNKENPQLIYDNLNSMRTNLNLSEKIKNYIFIDLEEKKQTELWSRYWQPLEHLFSFDDCLFTQFVFSYISMHCEKKITLNNIGTAFNQYYNLKRNYKTPEEIISEIFRFAQYFIRIKNADFSEDISKEIEKITAIFDTPELYSFLLEVTDDFQNNLIPKKIYIEILKNTYEYIKSAQKNNNKINFNKLSKTISQLLTNKYN